MEMTIRKDKGRVYIDVAGKIDESGSEELKRQFFALDRSSFSELVFDFKGVTYIGSACIGKLLLFYKELGDAGRYMQIVNVTPQVYELFRVVKLDTILSIS